MEQTHPPLGDHMPSSTLLASNLETLREMVVSLDTLTIAGQRHLMMKVIAFLDGYVGRLLHEASHGRRAVLFERLTDLRRESARQLPSVRAFGERAESLLALLASGA